MRILQVAARSVSLAQFGLPLMERLRDEGHEVHAVAGPDGATERMADSGSEFHEWPMGHTASPGRLLKGRRWLARFLDARPYDIVHTHCSFAGIAANPVVRPRTPCLIYTQHGFYVHDGLGPLKRRIWLGIEKVGLRHAHRVICISNAERDLAVTLGVGGPEKFHIVPGAGVDVARFQLSDAEHARRRAEVRDELCVSDEEILVLTVSRLTWDKGYRELISAVSELQADGVRFLCAAAGTGKDEAPIRDLIASAGVGDRLRLLGWREDVVDLCAAADVFVFCSHREGLPVSTIEAMASGLPVLASDLPGCKEEIENEVSGLLYPVRDAGALASGLRRLLGDSELRRSLGEAAAVRARRFDIAASLDAQMALYDEVAEEQ